MKKYKIITILLVLILTGCLTKSGTSVKSGTQSNVMKKYLHHCTYEIWAGFREYIRYNFLVVKDRNYVNIKLEELPKTDKINELIDVDIARHKVELKKIEEDKYFGEVHRKNIKIGDNQAVLVSYEFNGIRRKGESDFNDSLEKVENCYIKLKDKTILIKGHTFHGAYSKLVKQQWEEFYKSYRPDQSQAVKTNYGSFKWVSGLTDRSILQYLAYEAEGSVTYKIEITYVNKVEKEDTNEKLSFIEKTVDVLMNKAFVSKTISDTIVIEGNKVLYDEENVRISNGEGGKIADIRIFDFEPGIHIEASEEISGNFEKYRNELDAMIKSIKFYPELKKD
jgi:hypothetical protein